MAVAQEHGNDSLSSPIGQETLRRVINFGLYKTGIRFDCFLHQLLTEGIASLKPVLTESTFCATSVA